MNLLIAWKELKVDSNEKRGGKYFHVRVIALGVVYNPLKSYQTRPGSCKSLFCGSSAASAIHTRSNRCSINEACLLADVTP